MNSPEHRDDGVRGRTACRAAEEGGAEAGQVHGDHVTFVGEQVDDRLPRLPAVADPVHEE